MTNLPFHVLQETSARLLFMAVRWVRCLAPFQALAPQDQLVLLRAAWKDLFLLHLAQWSAPWDLTPLLSAPAARARLPPDPLADLELNTLQVGLLSPWQIHISVQVGFVSVKDREQKYKLQKTHSLHRCADANKLCLGRYYMLPL